MFIAALFTIARIWKQHKCPSTEEWIKKMWHIYTMEYDPAIPLLGIYPKKTKIQKESCTKMFIAALFNNSPEMETT